MIFFQQQGWNDLVKACTYQSGKNTRLPKWNFIITSQMGDGVLAVVSVLGSLQNIIVLRDNMIQALNRRIVRRDAAIASLETDKQSLEAKVRKLTTKVDALEEDAEDLKAKIGAIEAASRSQAEIDEISQSAVDGLYDFVCRNRRLLVGADDFELYFAQFETFAVSPEVVRRIPRENGEAVDDNEEEVAEIDIHTTAVDSSVIVDDDDATIEILV